MKNNSALPVIIVIILLILAGGIYFFTASKSVAPGTTATSTTSTDTTTTTTTTTASGTTVTYSCTVGGIVATYGTDSVALTLSDGRSLTLPQVRSGSGIRYESTSTPSGATTDIVFSSEGSNAFLTEGSKTTYDNCVGGIITTSTAGNGAKIFTDLSKTFSFEYQPVLAISGGGVGYSQSWMQNSTKSGMLLVKATLPGSYESKTNFADATFTVGTSADPTAVSNCLQSASNTNNPQRSQTTINGTQYTKIVSSDAGAGNFYQTTSYRTIRSGQCYAIEYTIHSTNIANYPPSAGIKAFDQTKVQNLLDGIVQSFKFL